MKPLNYDNSPCSPTSSNCVIWQGPDLDCIKLCKGDTISDVIASLATELCTVMDQLSITNYDLSCFELVGCKPETYQELLQFLIEQICLAQGLSTTGTSTDGKTNDTLITVAPCFIVNGITVMTLTDYVIAIGLRICSIIDQIALINNTLSELTIRVGNLENAVIPTYTLPSITVDCTLQDSPLVGAGTPAEPYQTIDRILSILINDDTYGYCALRTATGLPVKLISSVLSQCITNGDLQLSTKAAWSTNPAWEQTPTTVADTINNIWLAICDIYKYLKNIITVQDTNTVNLTLTSSNILSAEVQDTGWVKLEGFDTYMNDTAGTLYEYPQVRRIGNQLHFKGNIVIPLAETTSALRPWEYTATVNNYEEDPSTGNATTIATPYQGLGGVITGSFGSITFNRNALGSAESVIPVSVIPFSYQLDGAYQHPAGFKISQRIIKIASGTSTILTTLLTINLSATGILSLGLVKNTEESNINGNNNAFDTSHLNYIISHVISGESVPQFKTPSNIIHSLAGGGTSDLNLDFPIGTYPFSCNANDETEIGGFFMSITGLTAFISPCGTLIPTPTPCAIP
jgi:hypothetical protein